MVILANVYEYLSISNLEVISHLILNNIDENYIAAYIRLLTENVIDNKTILLGVT